ncbi:MAG: Ca-activated chloride channel [Chthoniobacter sp.]|nr:Ca-activated chloride channel [Chthoniobacter sp.]
MTFGAPNWFLALALLPALAVLFVWNERRRAVLLKQLVALRLMPELAASASAGKRRFRFALALAGLACVVVALARPQLGYTWQESKRKGRDVLLAIDTSKSMLATDLAPNRLTRAKLAAQDLINLLPGDRVGLIAFAGDAFLQAPLTIDYSAVLSSINELDTNIIPRGGTNITAAIKMAAEAFGKGESENRALVLMTDGEELDENAVAAAREHAHDFRVFTVGLGSETGSLIPVPDEQGGTTFVKDAAGEFVKSKLDSARLNEIAQAAEGFYVPLQNGPATMKQILENGLIPMGERDIDTRGSRQPIERYQWPLALGLLLLASSLLVSERRRATSLLATRAALAACLAMLPWSAFAANSGVEFYNRQNYKNALDEFQKQLARNPKSDALEFDAGAAAYKLGDYDKALEAFGRAAAGRDLQTRAKAEYNLGNTLFQRGAQQEAKDSKLREWQNALQHYEEAMKAQPKNDDAKTNREIVRKAIEDLQKPEPTPPPQNQDQKDQKQKDDQQKKEEKENPEQSKNDQQKDSQQQQQQKGGQSKDQQQSKGGEKNEPQKEKDAQGKPDKSDAEKREQQQKADASRQAPSDQKQADAKTGQTPEARAENSPAPAPTPGDQKLSGDIKAQPSEQKSGQEGEPMQAAPAKPGEMSEAQARALIESLRGEDERVQLNERQRAAGVLKDW